MGASYLDELGAEQPIWMGSYGIGRRASRPPRSSSRSTSTLHLAGSHRPFDVWLVAIGNEAPAHADRLADELGARGLTSMVDDREGSPGVRFADADLIGVPLRVTVASAPSATVPSTSVSGAQASPRRCRSRPPPTASRPASQPHAKLD